jgi:hypothetical protein
MMVAAGEPSPNTVCVAFRHKSQALQVRAAERSWSIDLRAWSETGAASLLSKFGFTVGRLVLIKEASFGSCTRFGTDTPD